MPENRQSNYDQVIENWRLKFLEMDQEKLTRKFHLEADEEALYIVYFSRKLMRSFFISSTFQKDFELTEKTDSLQKMGKALDLIR